MIKMFVYESIMDGKTRYCFCERTSQFLRSCPEVEDISSVFIHYLDEKGYREIVTELRRSH